MRKQAVPEHVLRLGISAELTDDVGAQEDGEVDVEILGVGDVLQHALREAAADHGGDLRQPPRLRGGDGRSGRAAGSRASA